MIVIKIFYKSIKSKPLGNPLHTTHHHHPTLTLNLCFSAAVVRSEHVGPFFDSTQSQVSYSEVSLRNGTRQCALGPIMGPTLYLWCLGSNLDV